MTDKGQESSKKNTTGQAPSDSKSQQQGQSPSMNQGAQKQGPDASKQNQTTGSTPQNQGTTQTQTQGSQQSGASIQSQAGTQISAQQQTRIKQSVLSARNVPRVNRVNFDIRTGAVVPRSVRFASVTTFPVLVEFFPQYRDYSFFVVEDEVVIVDRSHKIVDVVPAGPRARFSSGGGRGASSTTFVDLTEPEIRILQQTLIERGILRGRVTGRFDDRTRQALIVFQRRQGFEASGRIDTRTVTALGLSGRINAQDRSSTSQPGQSGTQTQQGQSGTQPGQAPSGQQSTTGQSNQPAQNQSSGQGKSETPSAQQDKDKSGQAPSQSQTTGQGSPSSGSTPSGQSGTSNKSDGSSSSKSEKSDKGDNKPAQNKQY